MSCAVSDKVTDRGTLLEELRSTAFAIAYRMLGSVTEAEDVVQEALLRVHHMFAAASALRWNWSTQIGATAATTALLAVLSARVFAELPSIHPP